MCVRLRGRSRTERGGPAAGGARRACTTRGRGRRPRGGGWGVCWRRTTWSRPSGGSSSTRPPPWGGGVAGPRPRRPARGQLAGVLRDGEVIVLDRAAATAATPAFILEKMNVPNQRSMLLPTANGGVERRKPGLRGGVRVGPPTSVAPAGRLPSREDWSTRAAPPCAPAPGSPAPPPPVFGRSTAAAPTGRLGAAFSCPPRPRAPSRQPSRPPPSPPALGARGRRGAGEAGRGRGGAGRPKDPCGWAMAHLSRPVIHPPPTRARPGPPRPPLPSPPTRRADRPTETLLAVFPKFVFQPPVGLKVGLWSVRGRASGAGGARR